MPLRAHNNPNGSLEYFETDTQERVSVIAAVHFEDDFIYPSLVIPAAASLESGVKWAKKIVGTGPPTVALVANAPEGHALVTLTADSEKQDANLNHGDQRSFCLDNGLVFEARVKLSTLPTGTAYLVFGLESAWADGPDAVTYSVFFAARGSGLIYCDCDDNATDVDVTSGVTVLATAYHIFRIDATNKADIRFYIDGARVAASTTFNFAGSAGDHSTLQPVFAGYKPSGTDVGALTVDYCRIWQASRSA